MANIDTYIFANGKLKLAIHGPRRGGNVLVYEHDGRTSQCEISDDYLDTVARHLTFAGRAEHLNVTEFFTALAEDFGIPGTVRL